MMESEKYNTRSVSVSGLLGNIENGDIAIPEIQRPFVWKGRQVRDLMDSLYKGYPTGYLIIWQNPNVRLKDGTVSSGKKILIDGQQRITALMTAIAGKTIVNSDYEKTRIKIAFNPFNALYADKDDALFEVQTVAHLKDKKWIPDIAEIFKSGFNFFSFIMEYCKENPDMGMEQLSNIITQLRNVANRQIGVIELSEKLDIDIVTDIFIRINSKGTTLSQGDFVMSKIAADETHGGTQLRKAIDYFAHLAIEPQHYDFIAEHDLEFASTPYLQKIKWLRNDMETVYDPTCDDILRVAFMTMYPRAKLADLVSLLSGRDFEERTYKSEIIDETYEKLTEGVKKFINEDNFKNFMVAIRSAGFISPKLVNSQMALDFAYTLYLRLKETKEVEISEVKRIIQKWYILSILTGRYSSSPESSFYRDIRVITEKGVVQTLKDIEDATLSDNFWDVRIPQDLEYTSTINPTFQAYLAAQVYFNDMSLLSNSTTVRELINLAGDIHHIFPKAYLKNNGFSKAQYNQEANYAYLDTQVNKSIGAKAPNEYFKEAFKQCETKQITCGSIVDLDKLITNLRSNCIPEGVEKMDQQDYSDFLVKRRQMMAKKIREYYYSL